MSLNERLDFEEGKINNEELFLRTCARCVYQANLVLQKQDYCHKCINNVKVRIKRKKGYSIEELYDYYKPIDKKEKKRKREGLLL